MVLFDQQTRPIPDGQLSQTVYGLIRDSKWQDAIEVLQPQLAVSTGLDGGRVFDSVTGFAQAPANSASCVPSTLHAQQQERPDSCAALSLLGHCYYHTSQFELAAQMCVREGSRWCDQQWWWRWQWTVNLCYWLSNWHQTHPIKTYNVTAYRYEQLAALNPDTEDYKLHHAHALYKVMMAAVRYPLGKASRGAYKALMCPIADPSSDTPGTNHRHLV